MVKLYCVHYVHFLAGRGGGWKSRPLKTQKNKMSLNIIRQEELIAQKKKEIEAKMAEQAKKNVQTPRKPLPQRCKNYVVLLSYQSFQIIDQYFLSAYITLICIHLH